MNPEILATQIVEAALAITGAADDDWETRTVPGGTFILDVPETPPAVWGEGQEVLWAHGEALMLCGPGGVGKTTLAIQLVAARCGIGKGSVFGYPIRPGQRVLYLAMDRPSQIARAMSRLFSEGDRAALDEKLVIWKGPPPYDLAKRPDALQAMCERFGADTVIVDSLKDAAIGLSDDSTGASYNRARQRALASGVEVVELHHQRKASAENKKPMKLDDVFGSTWLTSGAGSVFVLWGEAGDPVVEMSHLKQPMEQVGPWKVIHDHVEGTSELSSPVDIMAMVIANRGRLTARLLAVELFGTEKPNPPLVEKARRKLDRLTSLGLLVKTLGAGTEPAAYAAVPMDPLDIDTRTSR